MANCEHNPYLSLSLFVSGAEVGFSFATSLLVETSPLEVVLEIVLASVGVEVFRVGLADLLAALEELSSMDVSATSCCTTFMVLLLNVCR